MNTNVKTLLFSLLAVASLASCQKEPVGGEETATSNSLTIVAVTDGVLVPEWAAGDEIKVACDGKSYDFTTDAAGKTAKFTDDGSLTADKIGDNAVTAYFNCTSARGAFRISGQQTYKDGKSSAAIPMYAYTMNKPQNNSLALTFKPVASILRVSLPVHPIGVEKITVKPAADATVVEGAIAGTFSLKAEDGTVTVNNDAGQLEVNFDTPMDITSGGTVEIPVGMFSIIGGLEIVLTYDSVKEMSYVLGLEQSFKSYTEANGLKVGAIVPVEFELDANSFPRAYYVTVNAPATSKGQSWSSPATLDYALENAMAGSVIHMAAGTYKPTKALPYVSENEIPSTEELYGYEIARNIKIVGGYPASPSDGAVADASANKTILDGNNKSYHVMVVGAAKIPGEKVEIEGITIQGGYNTDAVTYPLTYGTEEDKYSASANYGAGLVILNTVVDFKNVTVANNNGHSAAGLYAAGSTISMTACTLTENTSTANGAGAWFSGNNVITMDGCTISKNDAGTAIVGGLYLHAPEGKSISATIKNTTISENKAKSQGGAYVRDDSGAHLIDAKFENCTFDGNSAGMGSHMHNLNAAVTFSSCTFKNAKGTSNGVVVFYDNCKAVFDRCVFESNETTGGGAGIYVYTNATGSTPTLTVTNSVFHNNVSNAKGTVWLRGDKGQVIFNCVNNTFHGNKTGNVGSAVNMYKNVTANIISNTIVGNTATYANDGARGGAVCLEAAPITVNAYNNIIAGNINSFDNAVEDVKVKAGTITNKYSFLTSEYYGADGVVASVTPAFDYKTMLAAYGNGVMKLIGNVSANPAVGKGMPAAELKALANEYVSADVLGKDQNGASRSGAVAGACVTQ